MNIALWIVQALLALAFLAAGVPKMFQPIATLSKRLPWTGQIPAWQVRLIGLAEALGALGLVLPGVTHIAPTLTIAAAAGLVIIMVGAVVFHIVKREGAVALFPAALGLLAFFVAYGRFVLAPLA